MVSCELDITADHSSTTENARFYTIEQELKTSIKGYRPMLSIYPSLETSGLSMLAGDIEHMSNKNGGFIDCCCFLEGSTLQNCINISPESSVIS